MVRSGSGGSVGVSRRYLNFLDWVDRWCFVGHGCCNRLIFFNGGVKGGCEEGFYFGLMYGAIAEIIHGRRWRL